MRLGVDDEDRVTLRREGGKWTFVPVFETVGDEIVGNPRRRWGGSFKLVIVDEEECERGIVFECLGL
jgi:hypothetical protein